MNARLRSTLDDLRRPLELAARDRFAKLETLGDLGMALRSACDRVLTAWPQPGLSAWRHSLEGFDRLEPTDKAVLVARGLRLLAGVASPPPPPRSSPRSAPQRDGAPVTNPLELPVQAIKGIGPAFAAALAERGVMTLEDLLWLVPRRYDDARAVTDVTAAIARGDGEHCVVGGQVQSARMVFARGRRWFDATLADGAGATLTMRWFGAYGSMSAKFPIGARAVVAGKIRVRGRRADMANPQVVSVATESSPANDHGRILMRYPEIPGLPGARLQKACHNAVDMIGDAALEDGVPDSVIAAMGLVPLAQALVSLHRPDTDDVGPLNLGTSEWHRRIAFGELFTLAATVELRRRERSRDQALPFTARCSLTELSLPFLPTNAQLRVIDEVCGDLASETPMNRLLQGDVGSGKTAVIYAAAATVALGGGQTAIMAPTEALAEQHMRTLEAWTRGRLRMGLLTASLPRGARQSLLSLIAAGAIDIVVGTHALLSEDVAFSRLGLVIIDEQHRFGVAQRVRLRVKGDGLAPHLLVATATPIPRTLAMTAYGDLDVSILDELPPGRQVVRTEVRRGARGRAQLESLIRTEVAAGGRAYVVCPRIEPSDGLIANSPSWADVVTTAESLAARLAPIPVAIAHGRMPAEDRTSALAAFRTGESPVLVATTLIEVGVDVPEATLMIIEDADHFGLAQLHQLRGRVGRGARASRCLLLTRGHATADGEMRLEVMASCHDGFVIAERDLELRGPGELLGARQAGLPRMRFGDVTAHSELLLEARQAAHDLLRQDPDLSDDRNAPLRRALARRAGTRVFGSEGG